MAGTENNDDLRLALNTAIEALNKKEAHSENNKLQNYLNDSKKTLSGVFYYDDKNEAEPDIAFYCDKVIKACKSLDAIKKKKFYNKQIDICSSAPSNLKFKRDNKGENILHAAIGIATECGEILEEVVRSKYKEEPLDVTNIKEEIGDITWYLAILLRDLDIDLFDAMAINIEKLKKRYPGEKFTTERANNRDLISERNVLENKTNTDFETIKNAILEDDRALPNGGLAPSKIWETKDLDSVQKAFVIDQMQKMYNRGEKINSSSNNHLFYVPINEFTKPFSNFENTNDYNGSFLVSLLKTESEIKKSALDLKINLDNELIACRQNKKIIVSIFDIIGSVSQKEEKKFLITFNFNPLMGIITLSSILFENSKDTKLSHRQIDELHNFCNAKKITL